MKRFTLLLIVSGWMLLFATMAKADVVANSVNDFGGTQGGNNWYYGYYSAPFTSNTFQPFPHFDAQFSTNEYNQYPTSLFGGADGWYLQWGNSITGGSGGVWTSLWTNGGHPNGTTHAWSVQPIEQWAVCRWVSDVSGTININGSLGSLNGGNMMTSILVNGSPVFSEQVPSSQTTYSFFTTVSLGSDIDFVIAPNNHDETNGATLFTAVISTTVPEPSTLALLGLSAVGLLRRRGLARFRGTGPALH